MNVRVHLASMAHNVWTRSIVFTVCARLGLQVCCVKATLMNVRVSRASLAVYASMERTDLRVPVCLRFRASCAMTRGRVVIGPANMEARVCPCRKPRAALFAFAPVGIVDRVVRRRTIRAMVVMAQADI